ncbi:MAG: DUF1566 domain-containing protein [Thermodesulfobacteriota bacterium]
MRRPEPGRAVPCFRLLVGLVLLALLPGVGHGLPRTGQLACYDEQGALTDHNGTGQDGDLQAGDIWPAPRFSDNGDGTVTDHLTGLVWLRDGACLGSLTWQGAMMAATDAGGDGVKSGCEGLVGHDDWQLPEIDQLETLFNAGEATPAGWLNRQRFRNVQAGTYWSRTTGSNPYAAWTLDFASREVRPVARVESHFCLLVRSLEGQGATPSPHLRDNGDGTITDSVTGLMWLTDGGCLGQGTWQDALAAVARLNEGDVAADCRGPRSAYRDWALPNRHELRSLIDHQRDLPALPTDHPFAGVQTRYWTSTTVVPMPSHAFALNLASGALSPEEKKRSAAIWAVRPADGRPARKRAEQEDAQGVKKDKFLLLSVGQSLSIHWPPLRFTAHGDGTITDNITGLMWLQNPSCFAAETWENALKVVAVLNREPEKLKCTEYAAAYGDWQLPEPAMLEELAAAAGVDEPASWLNGQGAAHLVARDYWTAEKNPLNLYFAWAVNLRQGTFRNYPKSFELHLWPVRRAGIGGPVAPVPLLTGNGLVDKLSLDQGEKLELSAAVSNAASPVPSIFRVWYVAPDGSSRWLTGEGEWVRQKTDLFVGNLFQLAPTQLFIADTTELGPGLYTFFLAVMPTEQWGGEEEAVISRLEMTIIADSSFEDTGGHENDEGKEAAEGRVREEVPVR